ncbi:MAG: metal ABC transporter ATP-binding protein [Patescibacteria group bacterium]
MAHPLLKVTNLSVDLENNRILDDINFEVNPGETLALIGPNGAGKSVLFRTLLGMHPYQGKIEWAPNVRLGYVPQRFNVEGDLPITVGEFLNLRSGKRRQIVKEIEALGFTKEILKDRLGFLSGGQQQRVLIAWALLDHPDLLLFDEPTAGVDIAGGETVYSLLNKLQEERKMTTIIISHELQIVFQHATKVLCINKSTICYGPPRTALTGEILSKLFRVEMEHHKERHHD